MIKLQLTLAFAIVFSLFGNSQSAFQTAYTNHSNVPAGLLEAVAWNNTHMVHLQNAPESCSGLPVAYGIMGLHDDGKNYFIENGAIVATLSGVTVDEQKLNADNQINAYAKAFDYLMEIRVNEGEFLNDGKTIRTVLHQLSEIPDSGVVNLLARDIQVYSVLKFMNSEEKASLHSFNVQNFNLPEVFGEANFAVLSSEKIRFMPEGILSDNNQLYTAVTSKSTEFGPAIWNPAPSCNYSSRSGTPISAITIHTIQGTYAGAISWAQNCNSNVSYHYVIRSSDGQVTQMVLEGDKAWHVGSENPYTIGYEHDGYVDDISWLTDPLYNSSAELSRDVVNSGYGIPSLRTYFGASSAGTNTLGGCTKIKGHQHYPNSTHTDPGINWDWERYYRLINDNPLITTVSSTGNFYDTGGNTGTYQDDERELWLFQPTGATNVTLSFITFDIEQDWDFLFIYDGETIDAPLIGTYTGTTIPSSITSTGNSLLVEFRSDCATISEGWEAMVTATIPPPTPPANDDCVGSISLTVNGDDLCGSITSGSIYAATASNEDSLSCGGTENDDVWYSFVAVANQHSIDIQNIIGSTTDLHHSVWEGSCNSLELFPGSCSDENSSVANSLVPGNTYYVRVNTNLPANQQNTSFDICIGTLAVIPDIDTIQPITQIIGASPWQTNDFSVNFTDTDDTAVSDKFYLVAEKTSSETSWHSNGNAGFVSEEFGDNSSNWLPITGSYILNGGKFIFSDVTEQNSNTYLSISQTNTNNYLYEWDQKITSSESNQRAGMHFFCDNPNLSNRGNSYFVYLRENDNAVEILSVDNDVFNSESSVSQTINVGETYNCKVLFNPSSGKIKVFINNVFISEWTDSTPLISGGFISLRTGGCAAEFDNVRVYKSRGNLANIITSGVNGEMRIESINAVPSGSVRSIVLDSANNWSNIDFETYLLDFSVPEMIGLNDGPSADIDTFAISTLQGNWDFQDPHSFIQSYEVAIGTLPTLDDIYPWTSNSISPALSTVLNNPIHNETYYISIRALNNAGLVSEFTSDGQIYLADLAVNDINNELIHLQLFPNPSSEFITIEGNTETLSLILYDSKGKVCIHQTIEAGEKINISALDRGHYSVLVSTNNYFSVKSLVIE